MKYLIIVLFFLMVFISGCSVNDCQLDLNCFKELVKDCSKARVNLIYEDNDVRLTSRGVWLGECRISLKIEKVGEQFKQQNPALATLAEGKTLNCKIPLEVIENDSEFIDEIINIEEKFDQYCSGPIKDALQGPLKEIITTKLKEESIN